MFCCLSFVDGDCYLGVTMKRDIVQFVEFNKFKDAHIGELAKEVLEEVPEQITGYMAMEKLHPLKKRDIVKQVTLEDIYSGPSSLVRVIMTEEETPEGTTTTTTSKGDDNKNKKSVGEVAKKKKLVKNVSKNRNKRKKRDNEDETEDDMPLKKKQKI